MNFRRNSRSRAASVQMASLMDVIFLLLCFFVTSSVFSQWETEVSITLPTAKSATIPGRMPGEIILNLNEKGEVSVNGQVLTLEDVIETLLGSEIVDEYDTVRDMQQLALDKWKKRRDSSSRLPSNE